MRTLMVALGVTAACGSSPDETATRFCHNVEVIFHETAALDLAKARRGLSDIGQCSDLNEASQSLRSTITAFQAAATPFRQRSEVARTLDALDKITLDELSQIRCDARESSSAAEIASLRQRIDRVDATFVAVAASCPSR